MRLVGDYRYSTSIIGEQRYVIIRNGDFLARVRRIEATENPVIWENGDPMTDAILDIFDGESTSH